MKIFKNGSIRIADYVFFPADVVRIYIETEFHLVINLRSGIIVHAYMDVAKEFLNFWENNNSVMDPQNDSQRNQI